jgi:hypothetical protein
MKSKIVMKTTTFVILLSLVQHSFYFKSNNRAHKRSPPKIAEKNREGATSATSAASPTVHSRHDF